MNPFSDETFLLPRPAKARQDIDVSWVYPNSYALGMSGLGYQLVWWLMEQEPDVQTFRVFTDIAESGWEKSSLIGFTLSWELDYANVLAILKKAAVPLLASQRSEEHPLIFGGGPSLTANPEPFAEIFDVILLGDAEITIPSFFSSWRENRSASCRKKILSQMSKVNGLYVPSLYSYELESKQGPIKQILAHDAAAAVLSKQAFSAPDDYIAHSVVLAPAGSWGDMFLLELVRSCPQECRFCLASYLTRPFRAANIDAVLQKIDLAMKYTKRVGIVGPSVTEHPKFSELAERLQQIPDLHISIASIRMDTIDPLILKMLLALGQKSVTIALESGSERLRLIMKKNLSEAEIWNGMDLIASSGMEQVKFYGMVGLPGETQDDLDETVRLISEIKKRYRRLRIVFGISSFVPKAQTPYQWSARDRRSGEKLEYLRKRLSKIGVEVRPESHNWSDIQTLLSRADRRLTPLLLELAESSGKLGAWKKAFKSMSEYSPSADFYIYREIPDTECLPWSHLMDESKKIILSRQRDLSYSAIGEIF